MKLFSRLVVSGLALALAFSLMVSPAQAAAKKKKSYSSESSSPKKHVITGVNQFGRSGFFYGDTSEVAGVGKVEGGINLTYNSGSFTAPPPFGGITEIGSGGSVIGFPAGVHFGIGDNLELSVAEIGANVSTGGVSLISGGVTTPVVTGTSSTNFSGMVGVKYHIVAEDLHALTFSAGGNVMTGISPSFGNVWFITPEGTISYVLPSNGMLLNGDLGIVIATQGPAYVKLDLGAGYPITDKLSGIAELGANQGGFTASVFALGVRYAFQEQFKGQVYLGVPLNYGNPLIGVGLTLASE